MAAGEAPDLLVLRAPIDRPLMEAVALLRDRWRSTPALATVCKPSAAASELTSWLRNGLDDFVCCPFHEIDFITRLRRWIPDRGAGSSAPARSASRDMLVGDSPAFVQAICRIPQVAASTAAVLVGGETGVGKELVARAIHYSGARRSAPFIPINCGALPDHLFENEMFGHAKGAYTDASTSQKGLLAEAEGGTIFLDEVDTLSASAQSKLLRFLQDREYRPLGSGKTLIADARVIAASNVDLRGRVEARAFREDLYYRLNILCLYVPPLRERPSDIPLLVDHFLARFARQYERRHLRVSEAAMCKLLAYAWPGNVRELESLLHRAVVFGRADVIAADDIELPCPGGSFPAAAAAADRKITSWDGSNAATFWVCSRSITAT